MASSLTEKIKTKKQQIQKLDATIERLHERKKALLDEVEKLQVIEIQGCLKEANIPFDQVREYILSLKQ